MAASVWVVDDDRLIRAAVLAILGELGYERRGFGSAEELYVTLVESGEVPDLLVLDQRLPDEHGSTVLHSLRERLRYRDIPVIFLTAIDDEEAERLSVMAPVVHKPFDVDELVTAVEANVRRHEPDADAVTEGDADAEGAERDAAVTDDSAAPQ